MKYSLVLILLLATCGCGPASTPSNQAASNNASAESDTNSGNATGQAPWVNRVWIKNDDNDLPGKLRIFLANGMLFMDSCWETYRLERWEQRSDSVVVWHEDTAEIEAHLEMVGDKELQVRLMLPGNTVTQRYQEADSPYLCPEMKR